MEHLCQSFNLLGYDVNEIRVIQPSGIAKPSQLIRSYFDLDQICQKYDGQAIPGNQKKREDWFPMKNLGEDSFNILVNYLGYSTTRYTSLVENEVVS